MVASGDVEAPITSLQPSPQRFDIKDVPRDGFTVETGQSTPVAAGSEQDFDLMTPPDQFARQIPTDESRCACDKTIHA